jgi:hypothetical protein
MSKVNEMNVFGGIAAVGSDQVASAEGYGNNNLRDLTLQFHESGKSIPQIYSILTGMGVPKDRATSACEQYIPKNNKNSNMVTIQEKLDLKGKLEKLHEEIGNFQTRNQDFVASIQNICERYLRDCDTHHPSTFTRALISELNNYNWMSPVEDCVNSISQSMIDNTIGVQINEAHDILFNSSQSQFYQSALGKLGNIRNKTEQELRDEVQYNMSEHMWIPQVKVIFESYAALSGNLSSTSEGTINKKYSPILETKDGIAFHLSGKI